MLKCSEALVRVFSISPTRLVVQVQECYDAECFACIAGRAVKILLVCTWCLLPDQIRSAWAGQHPPPAAPAPVRSNSIR